MERHLIDETENQEIIAYKGANKRIDGARFFPHEIGKTYAYEGRVEVYQSGFEAREYPLHVFNHYPPADSRFFLVRQSGAIDRGDDDTTTIASERVTVEAELSLPDLIARAVRWVWERAKPEQTSQPTGSRRAASTMDDYGAVSATGADSAAAAMGEGGRCIGYGQQQRSFRHGRPGRSFRHGQERRGLRDGHGWRGLRHRRP